MGPLIETWRDDLKNLLSPDPSLDSPTVSDIRIGVFYTAAQLSTGEVGVAFTPRDLADTVCCPKSAAAGPPAGRLAGESAWNLAEYALSRIPLRRAVGVAVLNALSALAIARFGILGGRSIQGLDALAAAGVKPEDHVAMVGAFTPFSKALTGTVASLVVIDKHPHALRPDEVPLWQPPEEALPALARADVVLITGSALVEGGLDVLLEAAQGARCLVVAGPTASPWPPTFFARGVDVLAGVRIFDSAGALRMVSEGGSGYVLFSKVGEKVCVVREPARS
jgi:uncharacterized protein (DUF4213/DUF364 family)